MIDNLVKKISNVEIIIFWRMFQDRYLENLEGHNIYIYEILCDYDE